MTTLALQNKDGMDQAKLLLPRLIVMAHAYANARKLRTHLTGVLNHGRQPKGYFDLFQYPHDANLTVNILLFELQSMGRIYQIPCVCNWIIVGERTKTSLFLTSLLSLLCLTFL